MPVMRRNAAPKKNDAGRLNVADDRYPYPCAGRRSDQAAAEGNSEPWAEAHAARRRQFGARSRRRAVQAVSQRRPRYRAAACRHGSGAGRHACAVGHAADLALRPGSVRRRRAVGDPERRHGAAGQGTPGPLLRHRHSADAGAGKGRRRIAPRHDQARHARRHDRLQYQRQESRRSEFRAALGDRRRARRLHGDPSRQRRRRRSACAPIISAI